jgi:hypothetical protein
LKKLNNGIYNWIFQQCITSVPKLSTELVNDIRDFSKTSTQFQIDDNEKINTKNLANVIVEIIAIPNGKVPNTQFSANALVNGMVNHSTSSHEIWINNSE